MGKKFKSLATKPMSSPKDLIVETLVDTIIAEYIQTSTVPGGIVRSAPRTMSDGRELICLWARCPWEKGCPQNFSDFISSMATSGIAMKPSTAFPWWSRSRLRYSCSTIAATIVRYMVPHMKTIGLSELRSQSTDQNLHMNNLECFSLGFIPDKTHAIELWHPCLPLRTEVVESLMPESFPPHCSHNVLKCRETGIIIDATLGQFLGTMSSYIFLDTDQFFSQVPGKVLYFVKTGEECIDSQISRDNAEFRSLVSPDSKPARFTNRVFRSLQTKKAYCWNCKGCASAGMSLKTCTKCRKAKYCCRECQVLHWKTHKNEHCHA